MRAGLTVVIAVFNREKEIGRCLDSIGAQTVRPTQVIVVDDGSSDASAEVARSHHAVTSVLEQPHGGAAAARNTGLAAVETEWVMFFDSDDVMAPDHVESALSEASEDVDIVGWDIERVMLDGSRRVNFFEPKNIEWHNLMHGTMATQRYMARTKLVRDAGCWNPRALIWNDIELGSRILKFKPRVVKVPGCRVTVYESAKSITGLSWKENIEKYKVTLGLLAETLGPEREEWIALKTAILAADVWREDKVTGRALYQGIARKSFKVRLGYLYRRLGGRGYARIVGFRF